MLSIDENYILMKVEIVKEVIACGDTFLYAAYRLHCIIVWQHFEMSSFESEQHNF